MFESSTLIDCTFLEAIFKKPAVFAHCHFKISDKSKKCVFNKTIFYDWAIFSNSCFAYGLEFNEVVYNKACSFSFKEGQDNSEASKTFEAISFFGSIFYDADFTNRKFLAKTDFSKCVFKKAPKFHGCEFHQDTIFPEQKNFHDTKSDEAVSAYRTLRLAMANLKARREEAMFYSLEQESLKNSGQMKLIESFTSRFYKWVSCYGQSISRPLFWLLGVFAVAGLFYGCLLTPFWNINAPIDWYLFQKIVRDSCHIAMLEIVKPFTMDASLDYPYLQKLLDVHQLLARVFILIQSVLSITCIALLLLSIRWKFKRD